MNRNVVGLDIAKQAFHLFMMLDGKAVKRKLKRSELLVFIAQLPPSLIALEACGGSHSERDGFCKPVSTIFSYPQIHFGALQ